MMLTAGDRVSANGQIAAFAENRQAVVGRDG
jgi:hypothetical protein